jgi:hypothetical protein
MLKAKEKSQHKIESFITPQAWDAIDKILRAANQATAEAPNQSWLDAHAKPVKSIANHVFKEYGIKLDANTKAKLGDVISNHWLCTSEFEYDI